jgi:hypothetical protein
MTKSKPTVKFKRSLETSGSVRKYQDCFERANALLSPLSPPSLLCLSKPELTVEGVKNKVLFVESCLPVQGMFLKSRLLFCGKISRETQGELLENCEGNRRKNPKVSIEEL